MKHFINTYLKRNDIGFRMLQMWVIFTVIFFVVQLVNREKFSDDVLTFLLPGVAIAYLWGRGDGLHESTLQKTKSEEKIAERVD
jgi:hypothetical protein